ncbi:MAG: AraC family transcriptional regulator, partial [Herbinix sp.]|nr:AraC family transcriptional regulator [Herbinix sp.]
YTLKKSVHEQEENCLLLQLITLLSKDASPDYSSGYDDIYSIAGYICEHYNEPADLGSFAAMAHLSRSRFCHLFVELIGYSPYHYLQRIRMDKAKELLLLSNLQISEIAENIGLTDPLYFSRIFKKYYGLSPLKFRQSRGGGKT